MEKNNNKVEQNTHCNFLELLLKKGMQYRLYFIVKDRSLSTVQSRFSDTFGLPRNCH